MPRLPLRLALFAVLTALATPLVHAHAPRTPAQQRPALQVIAREPLRGRLSFAALGLTGVNKENGLEYRLRNGIPEKLPEYVPRYLEGLPIHLAQATPEGWLALYASSIDARSDRNQRYRAALFALDGRRKWALELNRFLSRPRNLEIQDIRLRAGKLYFNEACQSYSREAGGRCSALLRVDPRGARLEWRTRHRVSNNVFIFSGPYLVAGYGFTAEPDSLHLISPETGRVVASRALDTAHYYLEERAGILHVVTHNSHYRMRF
jgi:hypothetical protein